MLQNPSKCDDLVISEVSMLINPSKCDETENWVVIHFHPTAPSFHTDDDPRISRTASL